MKKNNQDNSFSSATSISESELCARLAEVYGLPANATAQDILNVAANEKSRREREEADEKIIKEKMDAGLSRGQAIAVIGRQRAHDEANAKARATRLPALLKIIGRHKDDLRTARREAREDFPFLDGGEWESAVAAFNQPPTSA